MHAGRQATTMDLWCLRVAARHTNVSPPSIVFHSWNTPGAGFTNTSVRSRKQHNSDAHLHTQGKRSPARLRLPWVCKCASLLCCFLDRTEVFVNPAPGVFQEWNTIDGGLTFVCLAATRRHQRSMLVAWRPACNSTEAPGPRLLLRLVPPSPGLQRA